ncbi:MAG: hypothetical protein D6797_02405 [Bdellovibrio sp.]|nr:MAG: hypothetical protein D6797_02405 [Bdellovibrio sp.]
MYLSGKITHSVLTYLHNKGLQVDALHDLTDLPAEFLKDPSCWLEADKVEEFLDSLNQSYSHRLGVKNLYEEVGHLSRDLHSWGVLDGVLLMMKEPQEIFTHPQRFLSYFISPLPSVGELVLSDSMVEFELPLSEDNYPMACSYLKAVLEALPTFMGKEMAHVEWEGCQVCVRWNENQNPLFLEGGQGYNVQPEFMQSLVGELEKVQVSLEKHKRKLMLKNKEIKRLKSELEQTRAAASVMPDTESLQQSVLKLEDYFVRAQQLITLLTGQGEVDSQVKEAMERVQWDVVQEKFLEEVRYILDYLKKQQALCEPLIREDVHGLQHSETPRSADFR